MQHNRELKRSERADFLPVGAIVRAAIIHQVRSLPSRARAARVTERHSRTRRGPCLGVALREVYFAHADDATGASALDHRAERRSTTFVALKRHYRSTAAAAVATIGDATAIGDAAIGTSRRDHCSKLRGLIPWCGASIEHHSSSRRRERDRGQARGAVLGDESAVGDEGVAVEVRLRA